jgi:hypothetical protein
LRRFESGPPVRSFPSYRGQRNWPGWWWSSTTGAHVGFESWLERDHAMALDFAPQVAAFAAQPFWLILQIEDGEHAMNLYVHQRPVDRGPLNARISPVPGDLVRD